MDHFDETVPKPKVVAPTVNLNGTSRDQLVGQALDMHSAISNCREVFAEHPPHGRDYQTGDVSIYEAKAQHQRWREQLDRISREVMEYAMQIYQQQ